MEHSEYKKINGLSASMLKNAYHSYESYRFSLLDEDDSEPSEAIIMGDLFHRSVLEPHTVKEHYLILDEKPRKNSSSHKEIESENPNKIILAKSKVQSLLSCCEYTRIWLEHNIPSGERIIEQPFIGHDFESDRVAKCKPDLLIELTNIVFCYDLKTTTDAMPDSFFGDAYRYHYDIQAEWYRRILEQNFPNKKIIFVLVAISKNPPTIIAQYVVEQPFYDSGRKKITRAIKNINEEFVENRKPYLFRLTDKRSDCYE